MRPFLGRGFVCSQLTLASWNTLHERGEGPFGAALWLLLLLPLPLPLPLLVLCKGDLEGEEAPVTRPSAAAGAEAATAAATAVVAAATPAAGAAAAAAAAREAAATSEPASAPEAAAAAAAAAAPTPAADEDDEDDAPEPPVIAWMICDLCHAEPNLRMCWITASSSNSNNHTQAQPTAKCEKTLFSSERHQQHQRQCLCREAADAYEP